MSARSVAMTTLLAVCGCSSGSAPPTRVEGFHASVSVGAVTDLVFGPDSTPYLTTDVGLLKFDGTQFVPTTPALPDLAALGQFRIEADGTMYAYTYRLRPGASAWDALTLPCASPNQVLPASDGSLYTFCLDSSAPERETLFHQVGDGPWVAVGTAFAVTPRGYADQRGGVWFETQAEQLYVAHGDSLTYVSRSRNLGFVGADATRYYFLTRTADVTALFTPVLSVDAMGQERMVTRGSCLNRTLACPRRPDGMLGAAHGGVMTPNGNIYTTWSENISGIGTSPHMVMELRAGDVGWHAIGDITAAFPVDPQLLRLRVAPDGTPWVFFSRLPVSRIGRVD